MAFLKRHVKTGTHTRTDSGTKHTIIFYLKSVFYLMVWAFWWELKSHPKWDFLHIFRLTAFNIYCSQRKNSKTRPTHNGTNIQVWDEQSTHKHSTSRSFLLSSFTFKSDEPVLFAAMQTVCLLHLTHELLVRCTKQIFTQRRIKSNAMPFCLASAQILAP